MGLLFKTNFDRVWLVQHTRRVVSSSLITFRFNGHSHKEIVPPAVLGYSPGSKNHDRRCGDPTSLLPNRPEKHTRINK